MSEQLPVKLLLRPTKEAETWSPETPKSVIRTQMEELMVKETELSE